MFLKPVTTMKINQFFKIKYKFFLFGFLLSIISTLKEFSAKILAIVHPAKPAPTINILFLSKLNISYNKTKNGQMSDNSTL